jgi:uncharacterized protein with von Willebrand factor type A (vWA) domain
MSAAFDAASLRRSFTHIDDCPPHLLPSLITLPIGSLPARTAGVRAWREALLQGGLPPADVWPEAALSAPARQTLTELDIPRFCKAQPDLVDALLTDLLAAFQRQSTTLTQKTAEALAELERLERARLTPADKKPPPPLSEQTLARLREEAQRRARQGPHSKDTDLRGTWEERARAWSEIAGAFGDLGNLLGRGFDLSTSILRSTGWLEVQKLRKLLETLPQLREVVQQLGRLHRPQEGESVVSRILMPIRRVEVERREVRTPQAPTETRGVERSGDLSRMLPAEAALLGHPRLRLLWHARRAERALLTYRVEGIAFERVQIETDSLEEVDRPAPRPQRGPILAVIDTSGSMHGQPERVAKAIVLEALRAAHAEKRRCYLYAYSGPGEVMEQELSLSEAGLGRLMDFLTLTFGGGTDIGALHAVVKRLEEPDWKKADVMLVTDGEWRAPPTIIAKVTVAREAGTRFHGVQVGAVGRTGLHTLCEPVHEFRSWATLGGW